MTLNERISKIGVLFEVMDNRNASSYQIELVEQFRKTNPLLVEDLNFCFEVLAGKHKVGYTFSYVNSTISTEVYDNYTIVRFYDEILRTTGTTQDDIYEACMLTPISWQRFFFKLVNRIYRLGYTNRKAMISDKHCMLAQTYPKNVKEQYYYVQEKLNGNRCIAYFEDNKWKFTSRSQKPKEYPFDMTGLNTERIYDGEVMTRGKMGNRDFSATSGLANSKYGDKSDLIYFIYDILDDEMPYRDRLLELKTLKDKTSKDVVILKVLGLHWIYSNPEYNLVLDKHLDDIVAKGGEGVMLRDPYAPYYHSKHSGDRKPYLLKYKKTKTCDLRIVGVNPGKGKYEGLIGSFQCVSDDGLVEVNVAGMTDEVRAMDPEDAMFRIIEIAYFDTSISKSKNTISLQFPRIKQWRDDKSETSMF